MSDLSPLNYLTPCYYVKAGRVVTGTLGEFKDLVSKVYRDCRVQDRHYVVHCPNSLMYYVAKWEGDERWICGFRDKEKAQKTLELVQAKEILANAYGHLHLEHAGAQKELDAQHWYLAQHKQQA